MWDYLKRTGKPVVLYGTGNACERIIDILNAGDIPISGIFASDGFVRDRSFEGFKVKSYEQCREEFGDMIVLLCFGSHLPQVIENIKRIASEQELYAPDLPVVGDGLFTAEYMHKHNVDIKNLMNILADEESVRVLEKLLDYRTTGRIEYLFDAESDDDENWKILGLGTNESFMDVGAYTGDTIEQFLRLTGGRYKRIAAVEPEKRNFRKLTEKTAGLSDIQLINAAAGETPGEIMFTHGVGRGGAKGKGRTRPVSVVSIDDIVFSNPLVQDIIPVSFIKMDVEGEEAGALAGARRTLRELSPKLLVAAYHRIDDLWTLPNIILDANPDYRLYLRKSPCLPCWEVNYYCKTED